MVKYYAKNPINSSTVSYSNKKYLLNTVFYRGRLVVREETGNINVMFFVVSFKL